MTETRPTETAAELVLELRQVHAAYGHIHALKGVSLEVRKREIVTLIGGNGAGKSTTLRAISGLLKPRDGQILFHGQAIHGRQPHHIAALGIGHIPEGRRIFAPLSVEENLDLGAYIEPDRRVIRERKERVFAMFPRLAERRTQGGGTLSGGEQQMLAIGRALMQDPELLLLDEPTMGLAPVLVDTIFDVVVNLNQAGKTILLVEQNAWHALKIAHRGYVLETGTITLEGPAADLATNPSVRESYLGGA
ncbi:MAG: ABC transporter ATP-binding protein [Lentisphaerae bacterium RIFOXYB12_FULL_65_16]|nr:MAG: ABC transporter ATP-binding protein [Lentisphaerae bacterium RIFOXYA12_64_32]OGV86877.1 MAG: ABC transporter ATP-binding protein [Lentisphaerae bacterium RIFOXYB12_FULL_65_16]